jgi:hypothetical protein
MEHHPRMKKAHASAGRGKAVKWLREHVDYDGADCLIWPFSTVDGYGNFGLNGEMLYAHRYMCELVNGQPPSPTHHAAHECGNGPGGCVHPRHVNWKTPSENAQDRNTQLANWTGKQGVLSPDNIAEIRAARGVVTQAELAKKFKVSRGHIGAVMRGEKGWKNPLKGGLKFNDRYTARIGVGNGKSEYLGVFDTREEAAAAYRARFVELKRS